MEKPSALWRHLTSFRRKGRVGVNMSFIPCFDTPSVEGDIYLCWKNNAERKKGVDCAFEKIGPLESAISRRRLEEDTLFVFFTLTLQSDVYLVLGDLISIGCGLGLPCIAYLIDSQNMPKGRKNPDSPMVAILVAM